MCTKSADMPAASRNDLVKSAWPRLVLLLTTLCVSLAVAYLSIIILAYDRDLLLAPNPDFGEPGTMLMRIIDASLRESYQEVLVGESVAPYQFRLLKVYLVHWMTRGGLSFPEAWFGCAVVSTSLAFVLLSHLLYRATASPVKALTGTLYFAAVYPFFAMTGDLIEAAITLCIFALVYLVLLRERCSLLETISVSALCALGVLNRESCVACAMAYVVLRVWHGLRHDSLKIRALSFGKAAAVLGATALAYVAPRLVYAGAPLYPLSLQKAVLWGTISVPAYVHLNLTSPKILFSVLTLFLPVVILAARGWAASSLPMRVLMVTTLAVLLPSYFLLGQLSEARLYSETMLVSLPLFVLGLHTE